MNVQRTQVSWTCRASEVHGSKSDATGVCPHLHHIGLSGPSASHCGFWRCPRGTVTCTQPLLCSLSTTAMTLRCILAAQSSADPLTHAWWSHFTGAQVPCDSPVPVPSHSLPLVPLHLLRSELPVFSKRIALIPLPGMVFLGLSAWDVSLFALKDPIPLHAGALP